jgi:thiosulfate/3-mercaptopyruvate sulfurtransferase
LSADILVRAPDLALRLGEPQLLILDATVLLASPRFDGDYRAESGRDRYLTAHIPGTVFADLLGDLSDHAAPYHFAVPGPAALTDALRRLGVADGREIVVYDGESGLWAARLWWMLRSIGVAARVLDGGLKRWCELGLPVDSGSGSGSGSGEHATGGPAASGAAKYRAVAKYGAVAESLTTRVDPSAWVHRARVEAMVRREAPGTLVCALSADVFCGTAPTRYARRGHIPGSVNFPARDLFEADGSYAAPAALARRTRATLGSAERPLVIYCGGGISAAANALALTLQGERDVGIYDGSLEEWAADPGLPLELGS